MLVASILIPVYNSSLETRRCINSLLKNTHHDTRIRIKILDDASTDNDLWQFYETLNNEKIEIIKNDKNLGYTVTINKGIQACPDSDVILLNSDTIVTDKWLEKLQSHAYAFTRAGTVTPLSNNASDFSICNPDATNIDPDISEALNAMANQLAPGLHMISPTGHGFCMYIKRELINAIGLFDINNFPRGYGEENDFCLRARRAGYVNLVALDTYIWHKGNASFKSESAMLNKMAQDTLEAIYPAYFQEMENFKKNEEFKLIKKRLCNKAHEEYSHSFHAKRINGRINLFKITRNYIHNYGIIATIYKILKNFQHALANPEFQLLGKMADLSLNFETLSTFEKAAGNLNADKIMENAISFHHKNPEACLISQNSSSQDQIGQSLLKNNVRGACAWHVKKLLNRPYWHLLAYANQNKICYRMANPEKIFACQKFARGVYLYDVFPVSATPKDINANAHFIDYLLKCLRTSNASSNLILSEYDLLPIGALMELSNQPPAVHHAVWRSFNPGHQISTWTSSFTALCSFCDKIICLSQTIAAALKNYSPQLQEKIEVFPSFKQRRLF